MTYSRRSLRDLRALHLPDHLRVGERIEIRERLEVDAVGLPVEEQRVRLDRVQHRRRRALGNVDVDGPQVLGQDRGRRSVFRPDVLEHGGVAGLLGMMVDDQVHAIDQIAEVVRLDVHHRDAIEFGERCRRDRLDVHVEQVDHPQVFRARHALHGADDRRGLRAPEHVPQREAAGQRVGIGIVVQQDQHAVGVAEVALILLDPRPRQRPAEFGQQRSAEQLGHRQVRHVRELGAKLVGPLGGRGRAQAEHVHQRAARVAHRLQHLA